MRAAPRWTLPALACMVLALPACRDGDEEPRDGERGHAAVDTLPRPERTRGSVTGMPDAPGPGQVGVPELPADVPVDGDGEPVAPDLAATDGAQAASGTDGLADAPFAEPSPQEAVAVMRDYFGAINAGDFARAHALWSDGGNASGQTAQQLAESYAATNGLSVSVDAPSRIAAAAGSRYIEVPVAISATQRDGSLRQYVGSYTLRRSVADGADADQRAWRIVSTELREVQP